MVLSDGRPNKSHDSKYYPHVAAHAVCFHSTVFGLSCMAVLLVVVEPLNLTKIKYSAVHLENSRHPYDRPIFQNWTASILSLLPSVLVHTVLSDQAPNQQDIKNIYIGSKIHFL